MKGEKGVTIKGGCPDGFWALANCEAAAKLGFCSIVTRTDNRVVTVDGDHATVTSSVGRLQSVKKERDTL